jgi:hypothetical protein
MTPTVLFPAPAIPIKTMFDLPSHTISASEFYITKTPFQVVLGKGRDKIAGMLHLERGDRTSLNDLESS